MADEQLDASEEIVCFDLMTDFIDPEEAEKNGQITQQDREHIEKLA